MKTIFVSVTLVLWSSLFVSGQEGSALHNPRPQQLIRWTELQAEEQQLRELRKQWDKAFAAKDADTQANIFAADGMFMAGGPEPFEGRAAYRDSLLRVFKRPGIQLTHEPAKVEVSSGKDMAYELGSWKETWDEPDGLTTLTGRYFAVWKRVGGSWKIAAQTLKAYSCSGSSYCKK